MSLKLIKASGQAEASDDLHLARLLFLLGEAEKRSAKTIEGITKLAKLDFLLRYPNCLVRLLAFLDRDSAKADVKDYERTSIESKMVRFRYGPWDERYRRWIGLLVSKELAVTFLQGRTVHVGLTEKGKAVVEQLSQLSEFNDMKVRSDMIYKAVGTKGATAIKDLIYQVFPEIISLKWGHGIDI